MYDVPLLFEAREFLRKKLIGKKVQVVVDYTQEARDTYPEKLCCTVTVGGKYVILFCIFNYELELICLNIFILYADN